MSAVSHSMSPGDDLDLNPVRREFKEALSRNLRKSLTYSAMWHLTVIVLVLLLALAQRNAPRNQKVIVVPYRELQAPPSLQQTPPTVAVATPAAPPSAGIPLPTPDEQVKQETTIATQEELSQTIGTGETGHGDSLVIAPSNDLPAYGEYVYVEELPEAITKVNPSYPDLARQSGMEGRVIIQALVGKDGRVKDTKVVKSVPVFDDAAVSAVRQWVFKPALSNNRPVAVWVAVPVVFSLH